MNFSGFFLFFLSGFFSFSLTLISELSQAQRWKGSSEAPAAKTQIWKTEWRGTGGPECEEEEVMEGDP